MPPTSPLSRIAMALLVLVAVAATAVALSNHRQLAQQRATVDIDLRRETAGVRLWGMSYPESFGRWSEGPTVEIVFIRPLSGAYTLYLTALAEHNNVGKPVSLTWGEHKTAVSLTSAMATYKLSLPPADARALRIAVPDPRKTGGDGRYIGVALSRVTLVPEQ